MTRHLHYAPYLDYRPLANDDPAVDAFLERPECAWIGRGLEQAAQAYAVADVVPEHLAEVRAARLTLIDKTEAAVKDRLTKEISYWRRAARARRGGRQDRRAPQLGRGSADSSRVVCEVRRSARRAVAGQGAFVQAVRRLDTAVAEDIDAAPVEGGAGCAGERRSNAEIITVKPDDFPSLPENTGGQVPTHAQRDDT